MAIFYPHALIIFLLKQRTAPVLPNHSINIAKNLVETFIDLRHGFPIVYKNSPMENGSLVLLRLAGNP